MISVMMSYYEELYTFGELKKQNQELRYISQKKNRYGENRLRADGLLEYPSQTLAACYQPADFFGERRIQLLGPRVEDFFRICVWLHALNRDA